MRPRVLAGLTTAMLLLWAAGAVHADGYLVDTIHLPGAHPTSIAVYEHGNTVFVADDNSGNLLVIDGVSHQTIGTVAVGSSVLKLVVNQQAAKVYAVSEINPFTAGMTSGTGLVAVVNAVTSHLITHIDTGLQGTGSGNRFSVANDEAHGRVYLATAAGAGFIDTATDVFTLISAALGTFEDAPIALNNTLGELLIPQLFQLQFVNVNTLAVQPAPFPAGWTPLDLAVNEIQNKVYLTMLQGCCTLQLWILDRATRLYSPVVSGDADPEPLVFNRSTDRLFVGIQASIFGLPPALAGILDGATGAFTPINLGADGIGALAVRQSTDNAYFANLTDTFMVNGSRRIMHRFFTDAAGRGGTVVMNVAINQTTGRVYIVNDDLTANVTVIQDAPFSPSVQFDSGAPIQIPPLSTAESSIDASGITQAITKVTVSFYATGQFIPIDISLIGPDNTVVPLATTVLNSSLGSGCSPQSSRTAFDDDSITTLSLAQPPYAGAFRPSQHLAGFSGKSGAAANGTWKLRITNKASSFFTLTLSCWSLFITKVTPLFSDDPLTADSSVIRAVHITELRTRIDAVRARYGLSSYLYTNSAIVAGTSVVRGVDITEIRQALLEAYNKANRTPPIYTTSPGVGVAITVADISELRAAVIAIE